MNMLIKSKKEQLEIATTSNELSVLEQLRKSPYMNVRRAVARNKNISSTIADVLAYDPVLNVSFMALKNPKSTVNRDLCDDCFSICVLCEKDERYLECKDCEKRKKAQLEAKL